MHRELQVLKKGGGGEREPNTRAVAKSRIAVKPKKKVTFPHKEIFLEKWDGNGRNPSRGASSKEHQKQKLELKMG